MYVGAYRTPLCCEVNRKLLERDEKVTQESVAATGRGGDGS